MQGLCPPSQGSHHETPLHEHYSTDHCKPDIVCIAMCCMKLTAVPTSILCLMPPQFWPSPSAAGRGGAATLLGRCACCWLLWLLRRKVVGKRDGAKGSCALPLKPVFAPTAPLKADKPVASDPPDRTFLVIHFGARSAGRVAETSGLFRLHCISPKRPTTSSSLSRYNAVMASDHPDRACQRSRAVTTPTVTAAHSRVKVRRMHTICSAKCLITPLRTSTLQLWPAKVFTVFSCQAACTPTCSRLREQRREKLTPCCAHCLEPRSPASSGASPTCVSRRKNTTSKRLLPAEACGRNAGHLISVFARFGSGSWQGLTGSDCSCRLLVLGLLIFAISGTVYCFCLCRDETEEIC